MWINNEFANLSTCFIIMQSKQYKMKAENRD